MSDSAERAVIRGAEFAMHLTQRGIEPGVSALLAARHAAAIAGSDDDALLKLAQQVGDGVSERYGGKAPEGQSEKGEMSGVAAEFMRRQQQQAASSPNPLRRGA